MKRVSKLLLGGTFINRFDKLRKGREIMKRASTLLVGGTIVFLFSLFAWSTAHGQAGTDTLWAGEELHAGENLILPDGGRTLTMQGDGNLVLRGRKVESLLWQSGTAGNPGAYYKMQDDGNLVVRRADGKTLWASSTWGNPGSELVMEDDGNLVIYSPLRRVPLWESGTAGNPGAYYKMQDDGNLVVRSEDGELLWASGTYGNPGAELFIKDGNLTIFSAPVEKPVWSSQTSGNPGAYYKMQDDGNFVIYSSDGKALWATGTGGHPGARKRMLDGELQVYYPGCCDWDWTKMRRVCDPDRVWWRSGTAGVPDPELRMEADGNLVINSTAPTVLWETGTGGHPDSELVMEEDGNLVLYSALETQALWESGTAGDDHAGAALVMQADGNLVIKMPPVRKVIWTTYTYGNPGAYAIMQADGNFVVYSKDDKALWAAGTGHRYNHPPNPHLKLRSDGNLVLYFDDEPEWATDTFMPWMEKLGDAIADFSIRDLAIPGTHDSGTYGLNDRAFADDDNVERWLFDLDGFWLSNVELDLHWVEHHISWWPHVPYWTLDITFIPHAKELDLFSTTQGKSIYQQLQNGMRYIDMRVLYDHYHLYLIHVLKGPSVFAAIDSVNHYLREHPYEIVILDFNHFYTQNVSKSKIPDEWNRKLYGKILSSLGDLMIPPPADVNDLTMYDIWASGKQVIVFYGQAAPDDIDATNFWPGDKLRSEFFNQQSWSSAAGKVGLEQAMNDEAKCVVNLETKCKDKYADKRLWIMQGILSFDKDELRKYIKEKNWAELAVWLGGNKSAAGSVNDHVRDWALNGAYTQHINILLGDWAAESDLIKTAIQINLKKAGLDYLNPGIEGLPIDLSEPEPVPSTPLEETVDTIPVVIPPPDIRLEADGAWTGVDLGEGSAYDWVDGWLAATPSVGSGPFSIGTHAVTWSSSDMAGVTGTATQTVRIVVLEPVADETVLWPPNHKMSTVTIQANVVPGLQDLVTLSASVASNEPVEDPGKGDKAPDWGEPEIDQEKGIIRIPLRAERLAHGYGRIYTVTVVATDILGNQSEAIVQVDVPRDRSDKE